MAAKKLEVIITGTAKGAQKAIASVSTAATQMGTKFGGVAQKVAKAFAAVSVAGVAAVGAIGVGLYKVGASFKDAYNTIRVGTGATGQALAGLQEDFKQVVAAVPASFDDASTAIADLNTRLGLTGPPLQDLSKQFLELSRITKTDLGTNVDNITRVFGDWQIAADKMPGALDEIFRASQASGIGIEDLSQSVVQFGAPLRNLGFGFEDSLALLAQFNKTGVNTTTVFAGLKAGVGKLAKAGEPVPETFRRVVGEIQKLGPGSEATAKAIQLFGQRAGPDLADAITGGKFKVDELLKAITGGSDSILKAGKDTQDLGEKFKVLKNKVLVALEPVAMKVFDGINAAIDRLTPAFDEAVGGIRAFFAAFQAGDGDITSSGFAGRLEKFGLQARKVFDQIAAAWPGIRNGLIEGAQAVGRALGGLVQSLTPVVEGIARFVKANPKPVLIGLAAALTAVTVATTALAISENAALLPFYAVIAAIALLAGGLVWAYQHVGWFHTAVDAVASFITQTVVPAIAQLWGWFQDKLLPIIKQVATYYFTAYAAAFKVAVAAVDWLVPKLQQLYAWFSRNILPALRSVASYLMSSFKAAFATARDAIGWLAPKIQTAVDGAKRLLPVLQTVAGYISGAMSRAYEAAANAIGAVRAGVNALASALDRVRSAANTAVSAIRKIPGAGVVSGVISKIPGFAAGGRPPIGMPSIVGEHGPELFVPDRPGTIIPNAQTTAMAKRSLNEAAAAGGSTTVINQYIQVEGSVLAERKLVEVVRSGLIDTGRRTGRPVLAGY